MGIEAASVGEGQARYAALGRAEEVVGAGEDKLSSGSLGVWGDKDGVRVAV